MKDLFKLKAAIDCYDLEKIMEDINLPPQARTWDCIFPDTENGQYCSLGLTDKTIARYEKDIDWYNSNGSTIFDKEITIAKSMIKLIYELRKYVSDTEVLIYCWF